MGEPRRESLKDLKIGCLLRGEFRRLAPHLWAMWAWRTLGLPQPHRFVGGSAGAIAAAMCAPAMTPLGEEDTRSELHFKGATDIVAKLKKSDMFEVPFRKKAAAASAGVSALFPLLTLLEPDMSRKKRMLLHGIEEAASVGSLIWLFQEFLNSKSVFSPRPLRELMRRTLDFEGIAKSKTQVIAMATDIQTQDHVAFNLHDPANHDPERVLDILLASTALTPWFEPVVIDNRTLTDAEVKKTLPLEQFDDCDAVFVFYYLPFSETRAVPGNWPENLMITWGITKDENTRVSHRQYENICQSRPELPEVYFIQTNEFIPDLTIRNFSEKALRHSMEIGMRAVYNSAEEIGQVLGRAAARKEARAKKV